MQPKYGVLFYSFAENNFLGIYNKKIIPAEIAPKKKKRRRMEKEIN